MCASPTANPVGAKANARKDVPAPMPGYARDLAALDPWEASLQRSRARRERASTRSGRRGKRAGALAAVSPVSLAALIDARREAARDLSERDAWELSLGRSRARRRAAQLRFVPNSTRARRASLGALVAVAAAPAAALLDSSGGRASRSPPRPSRRLRPSTSLRCAAAAKAARSACCSRRSGSRSMASTAPKPKPPCAASRPHAV